MSDMAGLSRIATRSDHTSLALSADYVSDWEPIHAFRELYQNWIDGIVASFSVKATELKPVVNRSKKEICITVREPASQPADEATSKAQNDHSQKLFGYIRFHKDTGVLEITNFEASLEKAHLGMGASTKRQRNSFAGCHGEGLKIAALVMLRNNYAFKYEASSMHWKFSMKETEDLVTLTCDRKAATFETAKSDYNHDKAQPSFERGLISNVWEDVTVVIGKTRRDNDYEKIPHEVFESWLAIALNLQPHAYSNRIKTAKGDLLLHSAFAGHVYLHGLRISADGPDGNAYQYGYNFHEGSIGRDRERMKNSREQMRMVQLIWQAAIRLGGPALIDLYIDLFLAEEEYSDVAKAAESVSRETRGAVIRKIWKQLRDRYPGTYFYSETDHSSQIAPDSSSGNEEGIILNDLLRKPFKLPKKLWKIISKLPSVRTPVEARNEAFNRSCTVEPSTSSYHFHLKRVLQAFLALDERFKQLEFLFVTGETAVIADASAIGETAATGTTGIIDVLYSPRESLIRIHQKWLDYTEMHQNTMCEYFRITEGHAGVHDGFFCDHIVAGLLEALLDELCRPLDLSQKEASILRQRAVECFRQMPREVKICARPAGMEVSWTDNASRRLASRFGETVNYNVTLHKTSSCEARRQEVLKADETVPCRAPENEIADSRRRRNSCACPTRVTSQADSNVIFEELDHTESYFAMVSRAAAPAFLAIPSAPLAPLAPLAPAPQQLSATPEHPPLQVNMAASRDADGDVEMLNRTPRAALAGQQVQQIPEAHVIASRPASCILQEELDSWHTWHRASMPELYNDELITLPSLQKVEDGWFGIPIDCLTCPPWEKEHIFEPGQYACVQIKDEWTKHVILIHEIHQIESDSDIDQYVLVFTRFSYLSSLLSSQALEQEISAYSEKELIVHFKEFGKIEASADAESISVEDIVSAERYHSDGFFCRFGICTGMEPGLACFTPVPSPFLSRTDRWINPKYSRDELPVAFELSPNVLGAAEGLAQAGVAVHSAFGYDQDKHITWKVRSLELALSRRSIKASQVFPGYPPSETDVGTEHDFGQLQASLPKSTTPKIAIIAADKEVFRLSDANQVLPSLQEFLHPLEVAEKAMETLKPEFLAMFLPTSMLHPSARSRLYASMVSLLERRMAVHFRVTSLQEVGVAQSRKFLVVIASSCYGPLSWQCDHIYPKSTKEGLLPDRAAEDCWTAGDGNTESATRADRHTVAEIARIARIQKLPEDFAFYGPLETRYKAALGVVPPALAKKAAQTILRLIPGRLAATYGTPSKRLRLED